MSFKISGSRFGEYDTFVLFDEETGESAEIALNGAVLLKYNILMKNIHFNIIDGFADSTEFKAARGARSWIMIPFANRIPDGKYFFGGKEYKLNPIPPRTQVIHGFASYMNYKIISAASDASKAEVILGLNEIRPGLIEGYPFALDIYITFTLSKNKLSVEVKAENPEEFAAPFAPGWHPYFRTNDTGIENLVLTINADEIILLDKDYIPLPGNKAYAKLERFPDLNFNENISPEKRIINNRILDTCYTSLKKDETGRSECSIFDKASGMKIKMFQYGGVTLAFSGDSLAQRKRKAVALEPMKFITNAFNRSEYAESVAVKAGDASKFSFGVEIEKS